MGILCRAFRSHTPGAALHSALGRPKTTEGRETG
jgi:hypothetical protein